MTDETFPIPTSILDPVPGEHFLLKVHDDSMSGHGIASGDWVIIREQPTAGDGDVIAVMSAGDAIVTTAGQPGEGTVVGVVASVLKRL